MVLHSINMIQRNFLCGGNENRRRIAWVRWDTVCRSREEGGLGIKKNLQNFNLSLLRKGKCRMLTEREGIWLKVISVRYGDAAMRGNLLANNCEANRGSIWRMDLNKLEVQGSPKSGWLSSGLSGKLGSGSEILFWKEKWADTYTLTNCFPGLYQVTSLKDATVLDMGVWRNGTWYWNLLWRRNLFVWENELNNSLLSVLSSCSVKQNLENGWVWNGDNSGVYSVN